MKADQGDSVDRVLTIKKVANLETLETVLAGYLRYGTSFKSFSCGASIYFAPTQYVSQQYTQMMSIDFTSMRQTILRNIIFRNWILMILEL